MSEHTIKAKITAKLGSDFQALSATQALQALLTGWADFYNARHKKNSISFNIEIERDLKEELKKWNK